MLPYGCRVPRLDGGKMGAFATRSPHRPCPIGLSVARVLGVEGRSLLLGGADIVDGSPVLDIKPYVPFCDDVSGATAPQWVVARVSRRFLGCVRDRVELACARQGRLPRLPAAASRAPALPLISRALLVHRRPRKSRWMLASCACRQPPMRRCASAGGSWGRARCMQATRSIDSWWQRWV